MVARDGELIQFVSCNARAWHAGLSDFFGRERCNDFSIGIEIGGCDDLPFTAAQYDTVAAQLRELLAAYPRWARWPVTATSRPDGRPIRARTSTGTGWPAGLAWRRRCCLTALWGRLASES